MNTQLIRAKETSAIVNVLTFLDDTTHHGWLNSRLLVSTKQDDDVQADSARQPISIDYSCNGKAWSEYPWEANDTSNESSEEEQTHKKEETNTPHNKPNDNVTSNDTEIKPTQKDEIWNNKSMNENIVEKSHHNENNM